MKKILSTGLYLLVIALIAGCRKDINRTENNNNTDTDLLSVDGREGHGGGDCRLTALTGSLGLYLYHYNNRNLADEWKIPDYGTFKQDYDRDGELKRSKLFVDGELINTIYFFYNRKGDPVKEVWYNGNTNEKYDEVIYSYNRAGQMVKGESDMGDYYTITHYTPDGNVLDWTFYVSGSPYMSGHYKYIRRFTNPYLALPGIEYGFPFINQTLNYSKWWPSAEKIISYGEDGSAEVIQDYDPSKTTWTGASHNYPAAATYFDNITHAWKPYTFEYENCDGHGHGGHDDHKSINVSSFHSFKGNNRAVTKIMFTFGKDVAEKVMRYRK